MLLKMGNKPEETVQKAARIPVALWREIEEIKDTQAHPEISDSRFIVEAVRLYAALAREFGIDDKLMIRETIGAYHPTGAVKMRGPIERAGTKSKKTA